MIWERLDVRIPEYITMHLSNQSETVSQPSNTRVIENISHAAVYVMVPVIPLSLSKPIASPSLDVEA